MTLKDIQTKLHDKLKPSGWGDKLKMFILSQDFYEILSKLHQDVKAKKRFAPTLKDVFRNFEECSYKDLKVVIVGHELYPQADIADGILFSSSKTGEPTPHLKNIFKEIERTTDNPDGYVWDPDLKRWSNQGVLMLNIPMTSQVANANSHNKLWEPFNNYLFEMLNKYNTGIVYIFIGDDVLPWHKHVGKDNYKFFTTHPSLTSDWDSGNLFNNVNKLLKELNNEEIVW